MKVVGWTWYGNPKYEGRERQNLEDAFGDEVIGAIINALRDGGYKFTGDYHQNGDYGVPVLDDGTICYYSQRSWGGIMAHAYPDEIDDSDGYGYCMWAWVPPQAMVIPEGCDV